MNNELFQELEFGKQFEVCAADIKMENCSKEQLKELCLFYLISLHYRDQRMSEIAQAWAKGETDTLTDLKQNNPLNKNREIGGEYFD